MSIPDPFIWQTDDPLLRCKGESIRANQALRDSYLNGWSLRQQIAEYQKILRMANGDSTIKPPTVKFNTIEVWSRKLKWQDRKSRQAALDAAADKAEWDKRRREVREADYQDGLALRDLYRKIMAESPNFIKTKRKFIPGKNGIPDREIVIMALDGDLAVKAAKAASDLQRLASDGITKTLNMNIDLSKLTDEQVERLANGEDPLNVLAIPGTG